LTTADLVVEVISPSTAVYDRTTKADTYAALGVGELWLIDTKQQTVEQRILGTGEWNTVVIHSVEDAVQAVHLPGFICPARAIFS
jgi:Uma2 family endonuclease